MAFSVAQRSSSVLRLMLRSSNKIGQELAEGPCQHLTKRVVLPSLGPVAIQTASLHGHHGSTKPLVQATGRREVHAGIFNTNAAAPDILPLQGSTVDAAADKTTQASPRVMKRSHLYRFIAEVSQAEITKGQTITSVAHALDDMALNVTWSDGEVQAYPYAWLRDNCLCKQCYQSSLQSRIFSFTSIDVEMIPIYAVPGDEGKTVRLTWPDGHFGEYPSDWLRKHRFENSFTDPTFDSELQYWKTDLIDSGTLRRFNFHDIVSNDEALYEWLMEMKLTGICLVEGAGMVEGQVKHLGDRVLFLRSTYYGPTSHVVVKYNATNIAFTGKAFPMHTDLAFLHRPPGAQMIHCIEQAKGPGGENWFTDGFKVALDLKREDPEAFELLSTTLMEYQDIGEDVYGRFHQHSRHPTISLDRDGNPEHVYLSDHGRMPMMRIPVKNTQALYRALKKFSNMYHHPDNVCAYKLREGDIMTFDNRRVIHGRGSFEVTSNSSRHLETGYLEWDEINSRLRLLQHQFQASM
ncbi:gamma-butyrobetaine dioxygenase-like [Asterias rubens]|uniref:gamma-butyrobetaine dioxygenase-like n=1 Tax=Asterias rubens TaxID=7604 RepID=UPI001455CC7F|nr:gamma-butyrobetaine dioxygenase-like [Asterias rubens]XP_033637141.1 gamma-butyrobetaine dioxygenase-like [Asterias rubens]